MQIDNRGLPVAFVPASVPSSVPSSSGTEAGEGGSPSVFSTITRGGG